MMETEIEYQEPNFEIFDDEHGHICLECGVSFMCYCTPCEDDDAYRLCRDCE